MPPSLAQAVRRLYREVHPGWPELPGPHFWAYPTVVALDRPGSVLGYGSYSMNVSDHGDLSIMLQDSGVAEFARGRGLARELLKYRVTIGRAVGAQCAVGMTQPDNAAMLHILRSEGFEEIRTIERAYPDGKDGRLFIKKLKGL